MSQCSSAQLAPETPQVELPSIVVNGKSIDQSALSAELQYHQAESLEQAVQKAGQALVVRELLIQQLPEPSEALEVVEEEQAIADLINKNTHSSPISELDSMRYYQQNLEKFKTSPILEVSHILLSAGPDDIARRVEQESTAQSVLLKLQQDPALFNDLVIEFSDCPSNKTQGSLGQISSGQTVVEFERQLFALPEGLHDRPIESRYGYHVVYIHKKIDGKQLEFSMVEDQIDQYLQHLRHRQAIADYLYRLADVAEIQGIELQLEQENIHIG